MVNAQSMFGGMYPIATPVANFGTNTAPLTNSSKKIGWVFQAQSSGVIDAVLFHVAEISGVSPFYKASLYGVNNNQGTPNIVLSNTDTSIKIDTSGWQQLTLRNSHEVSRGDFLSLAVEYDSGTISNANHASISYESNGFGNNLAFFPYIVSGVTWSKMGVDLPIFGVRDGSQTFGYPILETTNSITGSGQRITQKFTLPESMAASYTVKGLIFSGLVMDSGIDYKIGIWDNTSQLYNTDINSNNFGDFTNPNLTGFLYFDETVLPKLVYGNTYYVGFEVVQSGNIELRTLQTPTSNDMSAMPLGTDCIHSIYNGDAWVDVPTERLYLDIILDDRTRPTGVLEGNSFEMFDSEFIRGNIFNE